MKIINDKNNEVNFSFKPHFCGDKTYISVDDLNETIDFYKVIINKLTDNISKIEKYCYERTYELKKVMERDKKIEKLIVNKNKLDGKWKNGSSYNYTVSMPQQVIIEKINEIIDVINENNM